MGRGRESIQHSLSRDVTNIHQKFAQGTRGCLVKALISPEERKIIGLLTFLGGWVYLIFSRSRDFRTRMATEIII